MSWEEDGAGFIVAQLDQWELETCRKTDQLMDTALSMTRNEFRESMVKLVFDGVKRWNRAHEIVDLEHALHDSKENDEPTTR